MVSYIACHCLHSTARHIAMHLSGNHLLPSCKARQVIQLRCRFAFVYIYTKILKISRDLGMSKKHRNKWWHLSTLTHLISLSIKSSRSSRVHSGPLCKGFRTSDAQRNVMGQSNEMSPLVSMLFLNIPKSLEIFNENFLIFYFVNVLHSYSYWCTMIL